MSYRRSRSLLFGLVPGATRGLLRLLGAAPGEARRSWRRPLSLEALEGRVLPSWTPLGPMPQSNKQVIEAGRREAAGNMTGLVTSLAFGFRFAGNLLPDVLFMGTYGGVY